MSAEQLHRWAAYLELDPPTADRLDVHAANQWWWSVEGHREPQKRRSTPDDYRMKWGGQRRTPKRRTDWRVLKARMRSHVKGQAKESKD